MLQTLVQDGQSSVDTSLQHGAVSRNPFIHSIRKPAIVLVFLLVVAAFTGAVLAKKNTTQRSEVPAAAKQQTTESENLNAADAKVSVPVEANTQPSSSPGNTNSVSIKSATTNGVTNTKLEVNGQEVPVEPNTTTTVNNGNQSVTSTNISTQNTQTGGSGFNFNSSISSSYNSSFSNGVGGNQ
jgi:hypothetical protein